MITPCAEEVGDILWEDGEAEEEQFQTRFLFGGADSEVARQALDLWLSCSKFSRGSKQTLSGTTDKQGQQRHCEVVRRQQRWEPDRSSSALTFWAEEPFRAASDLLSPHSQNAERRLDPAGKP